MAGYLSGFGVEHASEAVAGALPVGQNSPQRAPLGLYAEQLSGTAFTAPRAENRRAWLYRLRPSAAHPAYTPLEAGQLHTAPLATPPSPNRLRWSPLAAREGVDFLEGLTTLCAAGNAAAGQGMAAHVYGADRSMRRVLFDADGELLIAPQAGALRIATEFGVIDCAPGEICLIPRGVRFRVELPDGPARGYVCENYGAHFRLPERGPIGANGLANSRDFLTPVAAFEDVDEPVELIQKFDGGLWRTTLDHSPLDVVAWHGDLAPCKYDLARFNTIGSISFDHPDPSIFTVLTAPSDTPGTANVDFVIFPPRWLVAEHTFRPPYFHRNVMSEFMGLIRGEYDAKAGGFAPGGASLHNRMSAHGPDLASFERARDADLAPQKIADSLAFMFETRWPISALASPALQGDYDACWDGFPKAVVER